MPALAQPPDKEQRPSNLERKDASGDTLPAGARLRFGSARWYVRPHNLFFSPQSIAFSPDGRTIFTANQFDGLRALDVDTGKELFHVTLQWPPEPEGVFRAMMPVINFAFSKDCKTLATIQRHLQKVRLWEVSSGKLIREFSVPGFDAQSLEWSLDGSKMVMREYPAGPRPGGLRVWDLVKKAEIKLVDGEGKERRPEWGTISGNSRTLVGALGEEAAGLWDLRTGRLLHEIKLRPYNLDVSRDGAIFGSVEEKANQVRLWNVATGKELLAAKGIKDAPVSSFSFSPDGSMLFVSNKTALLWSVTEGKILRQFPLPDASWYFFSPDGKKLAWIDGSTLHICDAATGKEFHPHGGHKGMAENLLVSPDGKTLFSKARLDNKAYLWDMATGAVLRSIDLPEHAQGAPSFSSDGKLIANAEVSGVVRVWDVKTGKEVRQLSAGNAQSHPGLDSMDCHFSTDMKTMAAVGRASMHHPAPILIWDVETGKLVTQRQTPNDSIGCFSADNKLLALSVTEFHPSVPANEAVRPRGNVKVEYYLQVQDAASGRDLLKIPSSFIVQLQFSADGKTLAGVRHKASKSPSVQEICIWEVATGKERICFETKGIFIFSWSNDRRRIAKSGIDSSSNACFVYDAVTGQEIFKKRATDMKHGFWSTNFSADGKTLITGMADGTILAWDLPPEQRGESPGKEYGPKELLDLWTDLTKADAKKAHVAIWTLIAMPSKAVPFLSEHLRPASDKDAEKVQRCIAELDNASFATREAAQKELVRLYFDAKPAIQAALDKNPSLEVRHRLETIHAQDQSSNTLAQLRAIEILEYIGNPAARRSLEELAKGAPGARLTQEAMASLERLSRSPRSN